MELEITAVPFRPASKNHTIAEQENFRKEKELEAKRIEKALYFLSVLSKNINLAAEKGMYNFTLTFGDNIAMSYYHDYLKVEDIIISALKNLGYKVSAGASFSKGVVIGTITISW